MNHLQIYELANARIADLHRVADETRQGRSVLRRTRALRTRKPSVPRQRAIEPASC